MDDAATKRAGSLSRRRDRADRSPSVTVRPTCRSRCSDELGFTRDGYVSQRT
jgi:hypothetical protein